MKDFLIMSDHTKHANSTKNDTEIQAEEKVAGGKGQEVHNQLKDCRKELQEFKEKYLRVAADLSNFQVRVAKERALWAQEAQTDLILGLLVVLDSFDRALSEHKKTESDEKFAEWLDGFELVSKNLYKFLHEKGVHEIDCSTTFDPQYHEALAHVAVPDKESGEVIEVMQKGYLFNDKVIRPAKVAVAK